MKQAVIIEMSTEELVGTLTEVRATLAKLNLAHAVSPLENPVQIRETKKTVARILTEVRRRELEAQTKMETRNLRKERVGVVKSNKMDKSVTVIIERKERHAMYGKFVKKSSTMVAHDETNDCNIGDTVRIMETRPMSKSKNWRVVEILERAK